MPSQGQLYVVATASKKIAAGSSAASADAGLGQDDYRNKSFLLKNLTATVVVWLDKVTISSAPAAGGSEGTSAFPWDAAVDGTLTVDLEPGEELYARLPAAAASQSVYVLPVGR